MSQRGDHAACARNRLFRVLDVLRIEETWRLWSKFLDDYSRFEDWLRSAELAAADPDSADVLYTGAKEELKKFEVSVSPLKPDQMFDLQTEWVT